MKQLFSLLQKYWLLTTTVIIIPITVLSLYVFSNLIHIPGNDKFNHFLAYTVLAFPIALAKPKYWLFLLSGLFIYSGVLECGQYFIGRHTEWLDMFANGCGITTASITAWLVNWLFFTKKPKFGGMNLKVKESSQVTIKFR